MSGSFWNPSYNLSPVDIEIQAIDKGKHRGTDQTFSMILSLPGRGPAKLHPRAESLHGLVRQDAQARTDVVSDVSRPRPRSAKNRSMARHHPLRWLGNLPNDACDCRSRAGRTHHAGKASRLVTRVQQHSTLHDRWLSSERQRGLLRNDRLHQRQ